MWIEPPVRRCAGQHAEAGYSLIEIIVSLAILALTATVAFPGAVAMVERYEREARFRTIIQDVESLRAQAIAGGERIVLDSEGSSKPETIVTVPPGWRIYTDGALIFSPAAVCSGQGIVIVSDLEQRRYYSLDPAGCAFGGAGN